MNQQNARNNDRQRGPRRADRPRDQARNVPNNQEHPEDPKCPSQPDFENGHPRKIVINQRLGPEAKAIIKKNFAGLDMYLNDRIAHSHPLGAYLRSHFEKAMHSMVKGLTVGENVGHNLARHMRNERDYTFVTRDYLRQDIADKGYKRSYAHKSGLKEDLSNCHASGHWIKKWWSDTEHAVCPIASAYDQVRHQNWKSSIQNDTDMITYDRQEALNWCECLGTARILHTGVDPDTNLVWNGRHQYQMMRCRECNRNLDYSISSDAVYYDGVLEEHEFRLIEDNAQVLFAFNDYDYNVANGVNSGRYVDDEGVWKFDTKDGKITVQVKGNPIEYHHDIIQTDGKDSWVVKSRYPNYFLMFDTHSSVMNGDVPVRLCRMTKIRDPISYVKNVSPIDGTPARSNFFRLPVKPDIQINLLDARTPGDLRIEMNVEPIVNVVKDSAARLFDMVIENFKSRNEKLVYDPKEKTVTLLRWRENIFGCKYQLKPLMATASHLTYVLGRTMLMNKTQNVVMGFKKVTNEVELLMNDPTSEFYTQDKYEQIIRYHQLCEAYQIGDVISAVWSIDIGQNHLYSHAKQLAADTMDGIKLTYMNTIRWLCVHKCLNWVALLMIFALLFFGYRILGNWIRCLFARCDNGEWAALNHAIDDFVGPAIAAGITMIGIKRKLNVKSRPFVLESVCVRDVTRLDIEKNRGVFDAKWKVRNSDDWNLNFKTLPCDASDKPGALQCFPLFDHCLFTTACVCHSCKRTKAASAVRHTSFKLKASPYWWAKFEKFWDDKVIPEILRGFDDRVHIVDIEDWIVKYPLKYQQAIRETMLQPGWDEPQKYTYDAFPKIELQVTDVPYELMHTPANAVKERQICGPPMNKKILLNPIINYIEKIASECQRGFCGSATYVQIGDKVTDMRKVRRTYFSLDGSAFDNGQTHLCNMLLYRMLVAIFNHKNFMVKLPLTTKMALYVFLASIILKVNVDRGEVSYQADARASGDGWTTWGNTELMRAYVWFTCEVADINWNDWDGLFKGDDVLGSVDQLQRQALADAFRKLWATKNEEILYGIGQIAKFIKFGPLEEHDFLSCDLFWDEFDRATLVNKPKNILEKFWLTTKYDVNIYKSDKLDDICKNLVARALDKANCLDTLMGFTDMWSSMIQATRKIAAKYGVVTGSGIDVGYNDVYKNRRNDIGPLTNSLYEESLYYKHGFTYADIKQFIDTMHTSMDVFDVVNVPCLFKFFV